ncbi:MAG: alanine racemase [Candidatus Enterenecus sp.]
MELEQTRTWAEIDLSNLEHNYRALRACAPDSRFLGVVKANAYGHGAVPVARRLEELGADYLAVACLEEGLELRQAGIRMPILILGTTPPAQAEQVVAAGLTQAVFTPELAHALSDAAGKLGMMAKVHIKLDTGMSRLGLLCHDPKAAAKAAALCALPHLEHEGIFTHFANADGDEDYTMLQFTRFLDVLEELEKSYGVAFEIRHCAASAAVLKYPCTHMDMVRPGIALYGHYPDPSCQGLDGPGLLPVMTLKSRVAAVRDLPAGTPVSYGCTASIADGGGRVAVLPIGYADGLHRALSNKGSVWLAGQPRPIMGRVCMDMCMVGLDDGADVKPGDVAQVFGPDLPVERHADLAGTIQYELLCAVAPRVPRVYLG